MLRRRTRLGAFAIAAGGPPENNSEMHSEPLRKAVLSNEMNGDDSDESQEDLFSSNGQNCQSTMNTYPGPEHALVLLAMQILVL